MILVLLDLLVQCQIEIFSFFVLIFERDYRDLGYILYMQYAHSFVFFVDKNEFIFDFQIKDFVKIICRILIF
jgi:hypothetical protein